MTPEIWADSASSLAAAIGLVIVIRRMAATRKDPLSMRFRAALGLLALLMAVRVAAWVTGWAPFAVLTYAAAGAVPLVALLVAEGLLRRHAPPVLKWLALLGVPAFAVAAFLPFEAVPWRAPALLGFQLLVLVSLAVLVLLRPRDSLSKEENRAIDRMLLALLLILPVLAGDFRTGPIDLPLRTGAIGILALAWLSLGLGQARGGPRTVILGFLGVSALAAMAAIAVQGLAGLPLRAALQTFGVLLCVLMLLAIALEAHDLRAEARADSVLRHLALSPLHDADTFLSGIEGRGGVKDARLLAGHDLEDFDLARLQGLFISDPVRSASHRPALAPEDREQLDWLFARFEASHVLMVRAEPLTLLALVRPALGGAELADLELRALQRMAALVAARA